MSFLISEVPLYPQEDLRVLSRKAPLFHARRWLRGSTLGGTVPSKGISKPTHLS